MSSDNVTHCKEVDEFWSKQRATGKAAERCKDVSEMDTFPKRLPISSDSILLAHLPWPFTCKLSPVEMDSIKSDEFSSWMTMFATRLGEIRFTKGTLMKVRVFEIW